MGAQQSTATAQDAAPPKKCYYEILEIDRQATDEEIKKAYRRKALELHPDRNYGNVEAATLRFAEVSSAYEVLSDPQERAWYDSHRESILRGGNASGLGAEHDIGLTSVADLVSLIGQFNAKVPFTDAPSGFYGMLRNIFAKLAEEEYAAELHSSRGEEVYEYPGFGHALDNFEDTVRPFYRVWTNFSTKKSFSWRDAHNTADVPERTVRRIIEKENKRLREQGIREFNDTVRSLVAFVKKRDPRVIKNLQSEAEKEKSLREAAAAQAARSRAANQAKFQQHELPEWAKSQEPENLGEFSAPESDQSEVEEIECVVCNKTFKSEKQFETHQKSKKHIKAVQQLQREMKRENKLFGLATPTGNDATSIATEHLDRIDLSATESTIQTYELRSTHSEPSPLGDNIGNFTNRKTTTDSTSDSSELDEEYAATQDVERRISNMLSEKTKTSDPRDKIRDPSDIVNAKKSKVGMAKAKRAKKAARQGSEFKCASCNDSFASKSQLFDHIREFPDHARPSVKAKKGKVNMK